MSGNSSETQSSDSLSLWHKVQGWLTLFALYIVVLIISFGTMQALLNELIHVYPQLELELPPNVLIFIRKFQVFKQDLHLFFSHLIVFSSVLLPFLIKKISQNSSRIARVFNPVIKDERISPLSDDFVFTRIIPTLRILFLIVAVFSGILWLSFPNVTRAEPATFVYGLLAVYSEEAVKLFSSPSGNSEED